MNQFVHCLFVLTEVVQLLEINTHNVFPTLECASIIRSSFACLS